MLAHCRDRRRNFLMVTKRLLVAYWCNADSFGAAHLSKDALSQCMLRFMVRHGLVMCKKTNAAQWNSNVATVKEDFIAHIQWKKDLLGIANDNAVVNGDETYVHFLPSFEQTIEKCGEKTITIRKANGTSCCTVMLATSMGGTKLEPCVIHLGKPTRNGQIPKECCDPEGSGSAPGIKCMAQENARMDEVTMLD